MAKKKAVVRKGIFLTRNSKGIVVSIHAGNGRKLAVMSGYNNRRNADKGMEALFIALWSALGVVPTPEGGYLLVGERSVTDLTKPMKKTAKPKSK